MTRESPRISPASRRRAGEARLFRSPAGRIVESADTGSSVCPHEEECRRKQRLEDEQQHRVDHAVVPDDGERGEQEGSRFPGLGLGLAVCKRLMEAQRGEIFASAPPEGGLEVHLRFLQALE